jgi:aminoglycoside phosphotransferase (APT) family kinase protein
MNVEDPLQLVAYLRHHGYVRAGDAPDVRVLTGGVSGATVRVRLADGREWVLKKALAKLRTKVDWYSPVGRIHREAAGMRALAEILPAGGVPELVFEDRANHLIAMTAVPEPHENLKDVLMSGRVEDGPVGQFGRVLGTIHRAGAEHGRRLFEDFADRTFFESLRLEPYYLYAGRQVPAAAAFLDALVADTMDRRLSLVHGDYSPKNVLIRDGRLVLLDHEVIHFGDPAFDVGFAMAHLLSKGHALAGHRRAFARAAGVFWEAYRDELQGGGWVRSGGFVNHRPRGPAAAIEGWEVYERRCVRHALACLLAQVAGRSRLEYLSDGQRDVQQRVAVEMMGRPPEGVGELVGGFLERVD